MTEPPRATLTIKRKPKPSPSAPPNTNHTDQHPTVHLEGRFHSSHLHPNRSKRIIEGDEVLIHTTTTDPSLIDLITLHSVTHQKTIMELDGHLDMSRHRREWTIRLDARTVRKRFHGEGDVEKVQFLCHHRGQGAVVVLESEEFRIRKKKKGQGKSCITNRLEMRPRTTVERKDSSGGDGGDGQNVPTTPPPMRASSSSSSENKGGGGVAAEPDQTPPPKKNQGVKRCHSETDMSIQQQSSSSSSSSQQARFEFIPSFIPPSQSIPPPITPPLFTPEQSQPTTTMDTKTTCSQQLPTLEGTHNNGLFHVLIGQEIRSQVSSALLSELQLMPHTTLFLSIAYMHNNNHTNASDATLQCTQTEQQMMTTVSYVSRDYTDSCPFTGGGGGVDQNGNLRAYLKLTPQHYQMAADRRGQKKRYVKFAIHNDQRVLFLSDLMEIGMKKPQAPLALGVSKKKRAKFRKMDGGSSVVEMLPRQSGQTQLSVRDRELMVIGRRRVVGCGEKPIVVADDCGEMRDEEDDDVTTEGGSSQTVEGLDEKLWRVDCTLPIAQDEIVN